MTDILKDLNKDQKEAVTYEGGSLLVLAGAGSGKTKVLTHKVAYTIAQKKARPENVLLLTFTNKAAGEMKERVTKLISESPTFAGTFHSFCARLLRIDGAKIGIGRDFLIYDDTDQKDVIKDILDELNLPKEYFSPGAIASQISDAKTMMMSPLQYSEVAKGEHADKIFKIYLESGKSLILKL